MRKKKYNYGECEVCDTPLEEKQIKQDFWVRGKLMVVENVPAGVCPQCGEKVVKADIGRRISKLLGNTKQIKKARKISVPSIKFKAEELAV